ncbi:HNH endonuclease signature motif containing protein [Sphingobium sp. TomTYG75]
MMTNISPSDEARFWKAVDKRGNDDCWEWTRYREKPQHRSSISGYGNFSIMNKNIRAHRVSYIIHKGPIPEGMVIDHLCRNPCCVNPHHLEAVTSGVNSLRGTGAPAQNAKQEQCKAGHPYNEKNTRTNRKGRRICRPCQSAWLRQYRAGKRAALSTIEEPRG